MTVASPLRLGIVGVGFMGEQHAQAATTLPTVQLVAVADRDASRADEVGRQFDAQTFPTCAQMLRDVRPDALIVATSDAEHVTPTLAALEAGTPVLLEKPIATNEADADRIVEGVHKTKTPLLMGHVVRFAPRYRKVKAAIDRGDLGRVECIRASRLNLARQQQRLGGRVSVLLFLGVHDFDLLRWLTDSEARSVYARGVSRLFAGEPIETQDLVLTLVEMADGTVAVVTSGWLLPGTHPFKGEFRLEVLGTAGLAEVDLEEQGLRQVTAEGTVRPRFGHAVAQQLTHFVAVARGQEAPAVTAEDGRRALGMALAAEESLVTGKAVSLVGRA
jgi:predicted dehydrogenase